MSWLANFRLLPKLLALIGLLAVVIVVITLISVQSLRSLSESVHEIDVVADHALIAGQMTESILVSTLAEYSVSLDPRPENVKAAGERGEAEQKAFREGLETLRGKLSGEQVALLDDLRRVSIHTREHSARRWRSSAKRKAPRSTRICSA